MGQKSVINYDCIILITENPFKSARIIKWVIYETFHKTFASLVLYPKKLWILAQFAKMLGEYFR